MVRGVATNGILTGNTYPDGCLPLALILSPRGYGMHASMKGLSLHSYSRLSGPPGPPFGRPEDRLHAAKSRNQESWRNSWVPAFAGTTTKILVPRCVHAVAPRGGE